MGSKKIRKISNTKFLEIDKQQQQNIITNTQKKFYLYRRHKYFRWKFMQLVIFVYIFFLVRFYLILFDMHATCYLSQRLYLSLSVLCMCFARKCADGGNGGKMLEFEFGIENQSWLWSIAVWIGYLWSFNGDWPSYIDDSPTYSFLREFS